MGVTPQKKCHKIGRFRLLTKRTASFIIGALRCYREKTNFMTCLRACSTCFEIPNCFPLIGSKLLILERFSTKRIIICNANFSMVNSIDFFYVIFLTIVPLWFLLKKTLNLTVSKSMKITNKYHESYWSCL